MALKVTFGAARSQIVATSAELALANTLLAGPSVECMTDTVQRLSRIDKNTFSCETQGQRWFCYSVPVTGNLEAQTRSAYGQLFTALGGLNCLRIWNYVPEINTVANSLEHYQAFCLGRHQAFEQHFGCGARDEYCAASAVGAGDDHLSIVALATPQAVAHLENPAQCPAYEYPEQYGPRPPSFCRASYDAAGAVYISGTSAVIGSDSVGVGDLESQLRVTSENVQKILTLCAEQSGRDLMRERASFCRLYLRKSEDLAVATRWLATLPWIDLAQTMIVQADICRSNLMAEIELSYPRV